MPVDWDRAWDYQGDEGREKPPEVERSFEASDPQSNRAPTDGQDDGVDTENTEGAFGAPGPYADPEARATGPGNMTPPGAGEFDFSAGVELSRRPLGWTGKPKGRALVKPDEVRLAFSPHERLLILDTWQRSGLPAGDFAPLVGLSKHTLYLWKKRFAEHGPAGLSDQPRGAKTGSKLSEVTRRTIVMLKQAHPEWGCQRISNELARGPALGASPSAVARVLHEAGYRLEERTTRPHPDKVRRFERARPNQLWQTDLFTFVLKRQNRRLHLVGFLDDHSRFLVS
jgi:transposase